MKPCPNTGGGPELGGAPLKPPVPLKRKRYEVDRPASVGSSAETDGEPEWSVVLRRVVEIASHVVVLAIVALRAITVELRVTVEETQIPALGERLPFDIPEKKKR